MARTAVVRWTAWTAGVLVLVLLAAWIWWRESETAARWRQAEAMETFCGGVLAYERSPLFEGLPPSTKLLTDHKVGRDGHGCVMGRTRAQVTAALLPAGDPGGRNAERVLPPPFRGDLLPVPLTGGWRGAADGDSVRVLLSCRDSQDLVSVTVDQYLPRISHEAQDARQEGRGEWLPEDLYWARFATATAVKASEHWGCEADKGRPLRALPSFSGAEPLAGANGTCAGLPFAVDERLDTLSETVTSSSALYEACQVGALSHFDGRYWFLARFGAYATRDRDRVLPDDARDAGVGDHLLWGSARCPGHTERALFTAEIPPEAATVWMPGKKGKETFGMPAFREFAERSAERHGCTDLRLPPAS
ncbi:hypothetical protein [Streptomyces sp. MS1.AVA.4]|uniref:Uncharacterized protein n=1 Tax=Streptomyces pratisoli TaxID=3139917 RepID=A0ACC6QSW3_9ACTN